MEQAETRDVALHLRCAGQLPTTKHSLPQSRASAEAEKPCSGVMSFPLRAILKSGHQDCCGERATGIRGQRSRDISCNVQASP